MTPSFYTYQMPDLFLFDPNDLEKNWEIAKEQLQGNTRLLACSDGNRKISRITWAVRWIFTHVIPLFTDRTSKEATNYNLAKWLYFASLNKFFFQSGDKPDRLKELNALSPKDAWLQEFTQKVWALHQQGSSQRQAFADMQTLLTAYGEKHASKIRPGLLAKRKWVAFPPSSTQKTFGEGNLREVERLCQKDLSQKDIATIQRLYNNALTVNLSPTLKQQIYNHFTAHSSHFAKTPCTLSYTPPSPTATDKLSNEKREKEFEEELDKSHKRFTPPPKASVPQKSSLKPYGTLRGSKKVKLQLDDPEGGIQVTSPGGATPVIQRKHQKDQSSASSNELQQTEQQLPKYDADSNELQQTEQQLPKYEAEENDIDQQIQQCKQEKELVDKQISDLVSVSESLVSSKSEEIRTSTSPLCLRVIQAMQEAERNLLERALLLWHMFGKKTTVSVEAYTKQLGWQNNSIKYYQSQNWDAYNILRQPGTTFSLTQEHKNALDLFIDPYLLNIIKTSSQLLDHLTSMVNNPLGNLGALSTFLKQNIVAHAKRLQQLSAYNTQFFQQIVKEKTSQLEAFGFMHFPDPNDYSKQKFENIFELKSFYTHLEQFSSFWETFSGNFPKSITKNKKDQETLQNQLQTVTAVIKKAVEPGEVQPLQQAQKPKYLHAMEELQTTERILLSNALFLWYMYGNKTTKGKLSVAPYVKQLGWNEISIQEYEKWNAKGILTKNSLTSEQNNQLEVLLTNNLFQLIQQSSQLLDCLQKVLSNPLQNWQELSTFLIAHAQKYADAILPFQIYDRRFFKKLIQAKQGELHSFELVTDPQDPTKTLYKWIESTSFNLQLFYAHFLKFFPLWEQISKSLLENVEDKQSKGILKQLDETASALKQAGQEINEQAFTKQFDTMRKRNLTTSKANVIDVFTSYSGLVTKETNSLDLVSKTWDQFNKEEKKKLINGANASIKQTRNGSSPVNPQSQETAFYLKLATWQDKATGEKKKNRISFEKSDFEKICKWKWDGIANEVFVQKIQKGTTPEQQRLLQKSAAQYLNRKIKFNTDADKKAIAELITKWTIHPSNE